MKTFKTLLILNILIISNLLLAQSKTMQSFVENVNEKGLSLVWQTDQIFNVPESVLYDASSQRLYVSNIDGSPLEKNGNGYISLLSTDGEIIKQKWVSGLNAPKGMGISQGKLYVTDITEVLVIDINSATILKRIPIEGSSFLNDISIDGSGVVYVSDLKENKIHRLVKDKPELFMEGISSANGLKWFAENLYVLAKDQLLKVDSDKKISVIAKGIEGGADGVERVRENEFIVSGWQGCIYYIKADGSIQQIWDSREQKINTADIGFDPEKQIVYIPTFFDNRVLAYQLNMERI